MAHAVTRRSVLAGIGVGVGAALVGCTGDDSPSVSTATPGPERPEEPAEPEATDPPEEADATAADAATLVAALERAISLADRCRAIVGAQGQDERAQARVQAGLDDQVRVLTNVLEAGEIALPTPAPAPDTATSTSPGGDGESTTATAAPDEVATAALRALGSDLLADVAPAALETLATLSEVNLPMLLSLTAQRGAAAAALGQTPQWQELAGPTDGAAASLLEAYRPAIYGFEVLAARSGGDERASYETVLTALRAMTRQVTQLAGDSAPPAPLGYGLPEGTASSEGRTQLARQLLAALPPTIMGQTPALAGDAAGIAGSAQLLAEVVHVGRHWHPMTGFPGMQVPGA